jgi:hypothetical protein
MLKWGAATGLLSLAGGLASPTLAKARPIKTGDVAFAPPQSAPQPGGNAVPVTVDNFNRAETDMYFGKIVNGSGNLSHAASPI